MKLDHDRQGLPVEWNPTKSFTGPTHPTLTKVQVDRTNVQFSAASQPGMLPTVSR